jgi:hypothetical protein
MAKKITAPRKSGLHFETVPLAEVVKKTGPEAVVDGRQKGTGDPVVEPRPPRRRSERFHGVQFYNDAEVLCRIVGGFVGEGLEQGALSLVIATPDHAARIESELGARGIDVDAVKRHGCLVILDAFETLQLFMMDGLPHPGMFRRVVSAALTELRRGREHCSVRAYGEMVDLLWKDEREAAAIRVETLWNQFATTPDFQLLCAYSMGNFYKAAVIDAICHQHSHLIATNGDATVLPGVPAELVPALDDEPAREQSA